MKQIIAINNTKLVGRNKFEYIRSNMSLEFVKAKKGDAALLIEIYNESFYDDYIKYGECPAYGRTKERMEESIEKYPKNIIYYDGVPAGVISFEHKGQGEYYLGCLCIIPEYQGKGIGRHAVKYMLDFYSDWRKITLITPADKEENINFYTKKCGFTIDGTEMGGNVKMAHFVMERDTTLQ
jgi:ribosomal protein S18 acetylase RimI-like enzyme